MQTIDVNSLFARAEQSFAAGRIDAARGDLKHVLRIAGDHPAVLHLLALVEKKGGDRDAAAEAFRRAAALAPNDAKILANFANLLGEMGKTEEALALYDQAIAADPRFDDARFNRALLLQRIGHAELALSGLDSALRGGAGDARIQSARGGILLKLGRLEEAAAVYDEALRWAPTRLTALHGRARIAMERGEPGASERYRRALEQKPGDRELVLGLAEALEAEGNPLGLEILTRSVAASPDWIAGHESLARMRSEAGEHAHFADHYLASIQARPHDRALHESHWQVLFHGDRPGEALEALEQARNHLDDDSRLRLTEAVLTSEAGDPAKARSLLDAIEGDDFGILFARGRIALRVDDAGAAADWLERATRADPNAVAAWAHLALAWRLTGDPRHEWLCGQPGLFATRDIGCDAGELDDLAEILRSLHRTRAHPIGQSLRGGTQTRGRLFARGDPALVRLRTAIEAQVAAHFESLPPRDDTHPLLRHRDSPFEITGSWSVRLAASGFHVNHIHPEGVLSSACYISLPPSIGSGESRDGWLEIGSPPVELCLPLEPLASIEPRPGRLALFPSYLFHGTRPFDDGERLTVAFDVAAR